MVNAGSKQSISHSRLTSGKAWAALHICKHFILVKRLNLRMMLALKGGLKVMQLWWQRKTISGCARATIPWSSSGRR